MLKLTFLEYLRYFITIILGLRRTPKQQIIKKAEESFRKDIDVANIIKKLHDIETLKIILLNNDQLCLFNYLSKPLINFDENYSASTDEENLRTNLKKTKQIGQAYMRVHFVKNQMNNRLIELFDQKVCSSKRVMNFS